MITQAQSSKYTRYFLRTGLAFVFAYAGIDAIREPNVWAGFLPSIAFQYAPMKFVLDGFSISQLVLAAALIWNRTAFYAATVSAATLAGITVSSYVMDPHSFLITFRDVGLFFASLAMMAAEIPKRFMKRG